MPAVFSCPDEGVRPARGGRARPHDLRHGLEVQHGRDGGARRDHSLSRGLSGDSSIQLISCLRGFQTLSSTFFTGTKTLLTRPQLLKIMWIMMFRYVSMKGDVMEKQDRFF